MNKKDFFPVNLIKKDFSLFFWTCLNAAKEAEDEEIHRFWFDLAMDQVDEDRQPFEIPEKQKIEISSQRAGILGGKIYHFVKKSIKVLDEKQFVLRFKTALIKNDFLKEPQEKHNSMAMMALIVMGIVLLLQDKLKYASEERIAELKVEMLNSVTDSSLLKEWRAIKLENDQLTLKKAVIPGIYSIINKEFSEQSEYAQFLITGHIGVEIGLVFSLDDYEDTPNTTPYPQYLHNQVKSALISAGLK